MPQAALTGVCAVEVRYSLDEQGLLHDIVFVRGCEGNLKALGRLLEGRPATEAIALLDGLTCGHKNTSCADQFVQVLKRSR